MKRRSLTARGRVAIALAAMGALVLAVALLQTPLRGLPGAGHATPRGGGGSALAPGGVTPHNGSTPSSTRPRGGAGGGPEGAGAVAVSGLKRAIHGLLFRQGVPPSTMRAGLAGYVVQGPGAIGAVSWSELQASPGAAITSANPIDQALADVRTWNAANPAHLEVLKVRVSAGIHSPAWAMSLGGSCVQVSSPGSASGCVPRFWSSQFAAAFYAFESELAAKYDAVPEIAEIVMPRNMTIYAEPMIRQIADPASVARLLAAGYSTAVDEQNQMADLAALGARWKHTRIGFAFNPYQTLNPVGNDEAFTVQLMSYGRHVLGSRLVLENNSLRSAFVNGPGLYPTMYASMAQLGGPIGFQTATASKVGNLVTTIQDASGLGASSIELPGGSQLTVLEMASLGAGLPSSP